MTRKKRIGTIAGLFLSVALLGVAGYVIHLRLRQYHLADIVAAMHSLTPGQIALSSLMTVLSYWVLTGYDVMALRFIGFKLRYPRIAISSFISYSFSNSMGHPLIVGAVRYRLYSAWGVDALDITRILAFCTFTIWYGFIFLTGWLFALATLPIPAELHLPFTSLRILGVVFLLVVATYLALTALDRKGITIAKKNFRLPTFKLGLAQLAVSSSDWILAGTAFYFLLPAGHQVSYFNLISYFLMAQFIGISSQVPGGLGVFESVMLICLGSYLPAAQILGSLLAYRVVYYLLPLGLGTLLFALNELQKSKGVFKWAVGLYDKWMAPLAPHIYGVLCFIAGIVLLFSGATPALKYRLQFIGQILPIQVIELSHFLGSLVGMMLLFLARGLQRRINSAYILTVLTLTAGIIVSLLKGGDYEEAIILAVLLVLLLPSYSYFYRRSSLMNGTFSAPWIISVLAAVASTVWLGFFSYKHVQYSNELFWQFSLSDDAPRFLRMLVGMAVSIMVYILLKWQSAVHPKEVTSANPEDVKRVLALAKHTNANLALLGDKQFFFNEQKTAFIMYAIINRCWVVMSDPVGEEQDVRDLAWQFREYCDRHNSRIVFYEVSTSYLDLYLDMGLALWKVGETAKIDLNAFNLEQSDYKRQRRTVRTVEEAGGSFELLSAEQAELLLPELKQVSDVWMSRRKAHEKGFSLGFFDEEYLRLFPVAVVRYQGRIVAFANVWTTQNKEEASVDLMRYIPEAPAGVMEYLFIRLMQWSKEQGYQWFDIGIAPLSGMSNSNLAPLWQRFGNWIFRYGNSFARLQGLRQYKEKFKPQWEPVYIASEGGWALPEILYNVTTLISTGYRRQLKEQKAVAEPVIQEV